MFSFVKQLIHPVSGSDLAGLTPEETAFARQFDNVRLVHPVEGEAALPSDTIAFIGRNLETGRGETNVCGAWPARRKAQPFKIVSFYTVDTQYEEHAMRLKETLERHTLSYHLEPVETMGSWADNCAYKARFILKMWQAYDCPIVWLDADATVESYPVLFGAIDADFGMHKWNWDPAAPGWEFCSGTLYFGKSERAERLLKQWILRCEADPSTWDQVHLASAWCDVSAEQPLRTVWLPREYLQICDGEVVAPPVIKHWQASRVERKKPEAHGTEVVRFTEAGMRDRATNRLWRTPEEAFWVREGKAHIKPETGFSYPEGFDVARALHDAVGGAVPVLEIGCGVGRIASLFDANEYVGVDVNPNALKQARETLPGHRLKIHDAGIAYPDAPCVLFYTVLLHVADHVVDGLLAEAAEGRERFIIAELMDRRWRREGDPPVFNRDPEEYILKMAALGFALSGFSKFEYERYAVEPWNVGRDSRLTVLVFHRNGSPATP
ncbi:MULTISPECIES: class I SAM-dependent methyltransferase [Caballeronia]|uniref:class I SAM-dependent methyltransferase n=1 Tax=Caballeronia TaxID=1827195 RepID=UPI001EF4DE65|nr:MULTISPECIES: class I SAM-dependent methyltransferase [Caballeronia]MCG7402260.1 class I SAM-dependent methyltransferase [Caballeronia zhejiangensis]MCI1047134.1 class I SAM-dependent methyltransferase [Caballeronia zhejiangensis]